MDSIPLSPRSNLARGRLINCPLSTNNAQQAQFTYRTVQKCFFSSESDFLVIFQTSSPYFLKVF